MIMRGLLSLNADIADIQDGSLLIQFFGLNARFKNFIIGDSWCLPNNLPASVASVIRGLLILNTGANCLVWGNSGDGSFGLFMKEFYKDFPSYSWENLIWHKKHVLRYSVYAWLALGGGLKIADALNGHNIPADVALLFLSFPQRKCFSYVL
ncbi:hypothetical protein KFK09_024514 [Dendrobium nobile]|uniref:Uncharacterized protein n=1 Tax=Dendrobium nobile TaxID=94219 RepID=A0A8T3ADY4_DENNO|nr:hypothetical protein KFK09_024514 [Dendrobium nobile]